MDPGGDAADDGLEPASRRRRKMREIMLRHPEIVTVVSQHGRPDNGSDASPFSNVEFFAPLKPFDEWPPGYDQGKADRGTPGGVHRRIARRRSSISRNISRTTSRRRSPASKAPIRSRSSAPTSNTLEQIAAKVQHEMEQVRGVTDLGIFQVLGQPNLNIKVDREKAARYGLNTGDVNTVVQAALGGTVATTLLEGDRQFNVDRPPRAEISQQHRIGRQHQGRLYQRRWRQRLYSACVNSPTITLDTGASYIYHESTQRFIPIKFSVRGRDLGGTVAEAQERIAKNVKLPTGYRIVWAGEFEELAAGQGAPGDRRADQPGPDPGAALRPVQFAARQPAGAGRHSVRDRRRHRWRSSLRPGFQHLGRDRLRVAVRRVGHERHSDHHLLQPGQRRGHGRRSKPCSMRPSSGCGRC